MSLLAALLLAANAHAASLGAKPYGVILLGEGGSSEWTALAADVVKAMGPERPTVFAEGGEMADHRSIQKAVDELQTRRVEKIVGVPLYVTTYSEVMDQMRYLFGVRERPLPGQSSKRLKSKVPLVLAKALDDHPIMIEILGSRAAALMRDPPLEAVVLVGEAPADKEAASQWVATVAGLAQKVAAKAGMREGRAMALRAFQRPDKRAKSESEVRAALKQLRKAGGIVVVPLEVTPGLVHERLPKILEGVFVRYNGRSILPDARIALWAQQTAETAAKLPDMRQFKSETAPKSKGLTPPPAIDSKRGMKPL